MKELTKEHRELLEKAVKSRMIYPWGSKDRVMLIHFLDDILNSNTAVDDKKFVNSKDPRIKRYIVDSDTDFGLVSEDTGEDDK
jgi:hypothetical protein